MKKHAALALLVVLTTARRAAADDVPGAGAGAGAGGRPGETIDRAFDGRKVAQHFDESYENRVFLPVQLRSVAGPAPLVVFLHGVNGTHRRFRFMGAEGDPDLRVIAAQMIDARLVPPFVLAAPSSVLACDYPLSMWGAFDLDRLVEDTADLLRGRVAIDRDRIVLVGHSGAGCNNGGGVFGAVRESTIALRSVMLVDTCLSPDDAPLLTSLLPTTDVVVTYQTRSWDRPFDAFRAGFFDARAARIRSASSAAITIFEERSPGGPHIHNAMVEDTLRAYLPHALSLPPRETDGRVAAPPGAKSASPAPAGAPAAKDATHVQP